MVRSHSGEMGCRQFCPQGIRKGVSIGSGNAVKGMTCRLNAVE